MSAAPRGCRPAARHSGGICAIIYACGFHMAPATKKPATDLRIPVEVPVGIVGRWSPKQEVQVIKAVNAVREELEEVLDHSAATITVAPDLAPEAEQLWAKTGSQQHSLAQALVRCLPAETRRYFRSFKTVRARTQFVKLLRSLIKDLPSTRDTAQELAERAVRNCEVLIAIWTPPPGLAPPGVAPLISFALEKVGRTLYWIDPATGKVKRYDNYDLFIDSMSHLNLYNAVHVEAGRMAAGVKAEIKKLDDLASQAGLPGGTLNPLNQRVVPHFVRADRLASWWQLCYVYAGFAIYLLAAVAVATGVFATQGQSSTAFFEVAEMAMILLIICFAELREMLRRWLDYRFLAERLRAAMHLYAAGLSLKIEPAGESVQWMNRALLWICNCAPPQPLAGDLQAVKNFSLKGWIEDQGKYYFNRSIVLERWQNFWLIVGLILFLTAAAAAFFHGLGWMGSQTWWERVSIIAPACGASVAGFRAFREYRRTSLQYGGMVRKLSQIAGQLKSATTTADLKKLLAQADDAISQEHQGWRVLVHVHEPIEEI